MQAYEIIVIIVAATIVISVFGRLIYKKIKKIPTCDCGGSCGTSRTNLVKLYHKKYGKKSN